MSIFANVAEISAERMEELAGEASLRDAGATAGIATDKLLALSSDPFAQANEVCWSKYLASATVCKPVKTGAKTLS